MYGNCLCWRQIYSRAFSLASSWLAQLKSAPYVRSFMLACLCFVLTYLSLGFYFETIAVVGPILAPRLKTSTVFQFSFLCFVVSLRAFVDIKKTRPASQQEGMWFKTLFLLENGQGSHWTLLWAVELRCTVVGLWEIVCGLSQPRCVATGTMAS